ncbi:alpha-1,4-N-acetylglucosaminyltransferase-like [Malaclemys terrapin pileata]|uniref:alpha-1,4-N-acetylglucosaminyltransferase-like n=1 Tax=Malaclemys terrapin pileata TaxID=2991368 RepID=UPI0023A8EC87|nr:alpha-1,4-N-acetylglucosaminyltransferase-like [Malaclemys terrapin pileata]
MLKEIQIVLWFLFVFVISIFYKLSLKSGCIFSCMPIAKRFLTPEDVMSQSRSIIFVEITDRLEPLPLVSCSVESAARIYHDRPVVFFMAGLNNSTWLDSNSTYPAFSLLSAMKNVFIFPFQMETLFQETPLLAWYHKVNAAQEKYWVHISSDASRLALIWKYGGIYMDTDVISMRPIPVANFLAAEASKVSSSGVFGFPHHHWFIWDCMNDFVQNYNGRIWGNQGPILMTRRLRALCNLTNFHNVEDQRCGNISFLHPQRFYPIPYPAWRQYYTVWKRSPDFNNSYALHLWNFMNQGRKTAVAGSNTLVENLYKTYCPTTYKDLIQGTEGSGHMQQNKTE